jgi:hypothetical protein
MTAPKTHINASLGENKKKTLWKTIFIEDDSR